jgi:hypothetical protein
MIASEATSCAISSTTHENQAHAHTERRHSFTDKPSTSYSHNFSSNNAELASMPADSSRIRKKAISLSVMRQSDAYSSALVYTTNSEDASMSSSSSSSSSLSSASFMHVFPETLSDALSHLFAEKIVHVIKNIFSSVPVKQSVLILPDLIASFGRF